MTIAIENVVAVVDQFVVRTKGFPAGSVAADTALMREGYVDSFGIAELTTEVERALGLQLPAGTLIPEDFESPRVLWERLRDVAG